MRKKNGWRRPPSVSKSEKDATPRRLRNPVAGDADHTGKGLEILLCFAMNAINSGLLRQANNIPRCAIGHSAIFVSKDALRIKG